MIESSWNEILKRLECTHTVKTLFVKQYNLEIKLSVKSSISISAHLFALNQC